MFWFFETPVFCAISSRVRSGRGDRGARGACYALPLPVSYPLGETSADGVAALSAVSAGEALAAFLARLLRISSR
jgi:hypothetical protein